jgi:hypothetical protein
MIRRSGFKTEAFINAIARTIAGGEVRDVDPARLTRAVIEDGDGVIYLAAGYWRAVPVWDERDQLDGVRLINPERTAGECASVERGISILRHLEYEDDV